jgi:F-type H+-transporting ATPase subunit g
MRPFTTALRPFFRQSAGRRYASTNSEGAQKKAQDALGSVQKNAEKAWETAKKALGPVGEKAGNMLGCEYFLSVLPFTHWLDVRFQFKK